MGEEDEQPQPCIEKICARHASSRKEQKVKMEGRAQKDGFLLIRLSLSLLILRNNGIKMKKALTPTKSNPTSNNATLCRGWKERIKPSCAPY